MNSLDDQTADSKGVVRYYLENESDTDLGFALEKITVNGMPMFYAKTYTLYSDNGDILIPATSLEAFGIDRVDELQFVVHGESVDDREAFWDAIDSGDYFENKDEEVYDTVTVHPTGMTDEEINEAISVTEKDCAAYVSGDGFVLGVLKEVNMSNPYGSLTVYFENRTSEELYLTWEDITVNGKKFVYQDDPEETSGRQVTLRLPPDTRGYMPVLSRYELETSGIDDNIKELVCSVYHKEHPAQGNQFASYSEKINCSFSD